MTIISRFDSFEGIRENVLRVARAVGEEERGRSLLREMDQRLHAASPHGTRWKKAPRVLFIGPGGYTAGRSTTLDEVIRLAGGHNVAGEVLNGIGHLSPEAMLSLRPEVLLRSSFASLDAATRRLFTWQAKREGGEPLEVVISANRLTSVSPYLALAVEELGLALEGGEGREPR
jgi:iron complex transport system substrate-binding protein